MRHTGPAQCSVTAHAGKDATYFTGATEDSQGLVGEAEGGTLFLDEVGEMPASCQAKLLRFLEDGKVRPVGGGREWTVDVRVIAATNALLRKQEREGTFRSDLLARLDGIALVLPALRERRVDIPALLLRFARDQGWSSVLVEPDALEALLVHRWDWNVRQLKRLVARWSQMVWRVRTAGGQTPVLRLDDLDMQFKDPVVNRLTAATPPVLKRRKRPSENELLEALEAAEWNLQVVADRFKKDRKQIYRWMERYGIGRRVSP